MVKIFKQKLLLLLAVTFLTSSCGIETALILGGGGVVVANTAKEKSYGQSLDDETIKTKITAAILDKVGKFFDIYIDVNQGNVLLTGDVKTSADKQKVQNIAKQQEGVKIVFNRLEIGEGRTIGQKTSDKLTSANISRKILFDKKTDYINQYITVYKNKVYIMGIAKTEAELDKIIGIAKAESGVEKVETFVKVK